MRESNLQNMEQDQVNACASLSCPLPSHSGDIRIPVCILDGSNSQQQQEHSQEPSELEPKSLDYCSRKGKFGWHVIGKKALPYVHRNGTEKFCPVRIAEAELLNQFLLNLPPDVINCTSIQSYLITEAEVLLLNEINYRHSKCTFGREPFTTQDLLVSIFDVGEFYEFLQLCHQRLVLQQITACDRCGLIRIGGERGPVVPYTMSKDNVKVIPLIFFEGRIQDLRKTSTFIDGWELVYLRFCCKVLGIRKELYQPKICEVVSLQSVQAEFPIGTLFEEFWPMSVQGALNVKSSAMSTTPPQNSVNIQVAQTQPFSDLTQLPNSLIPSQPSFGTNALNVAQPLTGNTVSEISGGLRSPAAAFPHILNLQTGLSSFVTWPPSVPLQLYKGNTGVALPATKTNHCISSLSSSSSQSVLSQDWRVSAYAIAGNPEHLQNPDQLSGTVALLTGSTAGSNTDRTSVVNQIQPTSLNAVVPGSIGNGRQGAKRTVPAVMETQGHLGRQEHRILPKTGQEQPSLMNFPTNPMLMIGQSPVQQNGMLRPCWPNLFPQMQPYQISQTRIHDSVPVKSLLKKVDSRLKPRDILPKVKFGTVNQGISQLGPVVLSSCNNAPSKRMRTD